MCERGCPSRSASSRTRGDRPRLRRRCAPSSPPRASRRWSRRSAAPAPAARWSELWSDGLRGRTLALWAAWFGINFSYYGAFIWIPSLLVSQGFSLTRSFGFTLIITLAQLPGYAAAAFLIEAWGRRATLATFLAGSAISAYAFGQAGSEAAIIAAGCALSFFNLGAWGALYAVTPEVYPTSLRGTGAGSAAAFGRIASILAPLSVPWLLDLGGTGLVFTVFGVAFALAAAAALALPEWRGRTRPLTGGWRRSFGWNPVRGHTRRPGVVGHLEPLTS